MGFKDNDTSTMQLETIFELFDVDFELFDVDFGEYCSASSVTTSGSYSLSGTKSSSSSSSSRTSHSMSTTTNAEMSERSLFKETHYNTTKEEECCGAYIHSDSIPSSPKRSWNPQDYVVETNAGNIAVPTSNLSRTSKLNKSKTPSYLLLPKKQQAFSYLSSMIYLPTRYLPKKQLRKQ
jgi:hypothetical protein